MPVALVTGATRGLGKALTTALAERHWSLLIDARDPARLAEAADALRAAGAPQVLAVAGDIADGGHRTRLAAAVAEVTAEAPSKPETSSAALDLLVNNASTLGPSPQPPLADYPLTDLERVYAVNTLAPLALTQVLLPYLEQAGGRIVNVTSDAAVEPYAGWGGYGSSKAALEQLTAILGAELPHLRIYAFDPGDMRTQMHQEAFPGEDISDRPLPETVVPSLLRLVDEQLPSGRLRAADLAEAVPA